MAIVFGAVATGCSLSPKAAEIPVVVVDLSATLPAAPVAVRTISPSSVEPHAPQSVHRPSTQGPDREHKTTLGPKVATSKPPTVTTPPTRPKATKARKPGSCHPQDPLCSDLP